MRHFTQFLIFFCLLVSPALATPQHAIALHGQPKYAADFKQLDYVNPDSPKGGRFLQPQFGTFDSLNPFILKGTPAISVGSTIATLLTSTADEPMSAYGYVAEAVEIATDRKTVTFTLRPQAVFHDGTPITAADVAWTFDTLKSKGHPMYRIYYTNVVKAEALGKRTVRFTVDDPNNRELPLIIGQLPILSKAYYSKVEFDKSSLTPPLGSGPYKVGKFEAGRYLELERVSNWWGAKLPIFVGRFNFDIMRDDYYRDYEVAFEAFAAGKLDFREENIARRWAQAYDNLPAYKDGRILKVPFTIKQPAQTQGFLFNLRRPQFQDRRVREALALAYDFEWANKNLAFGAYKRIRSYFDNSELAATGVPTGDELALLEPYRDALPPQVFTTEFQPSITDGSGNNRANMKRAFELLDAAGYKLMDDKLIGPDGKQLTFEILNNHGGGLDRWVLPYIRNLERLGVKATFRTLDDAQFINRVNDFDFDSIIAPFAQSLSPGNEQRDYWGSAKADIKGSRNWMGIKDPVVDALIEKLLVADNREELVTTTRALDRVLQWGFYMVPHWYSADKRIAMWDKFGRPPVNPPYALALDTWWAK